MFFARHGELLTLECGLIIVNVSSNNSVYIFIYKVNNAVASSFMYDDVTQ